MNGLRKKRALMATVRGIWRDSELRLFRARQLALAGRYRRALQAIGSAYWAYRDPQAAMLLAANILELEYLAGAASLSNVHHARALYWRILCLNPTHEGAWADLQDNTELLTEAQP